MAKLALFDMDGTLSDDSHRQQLYLDKRYSEYFDYDAQMADEVYPQARALFDELQRDGWVLGVLTARLEKNLPATWDWTIKHQFALPFGVLARPWQMSDVRPPVFKSSVIRNIIDAGRYEHVVLVDNDPKVITQITEDHGAEHVLFADWDKNKHLASIAPGDV